jgi:hypothetical protein
MVFVPSLFKCFILGQAPDRKSLETKLPEILDHLGDYAARLKEGQGRGTTIKSAWPISKGDIQRMSGRSTLSSFRKRLPSETGPVGYADLKKGFCTEAG